MNYPCNLIKDILPLYHDKACSLESAFAVDKHFAECPECKEYYQSMCESDIVESFAYETEKEMKRAESFKKIKKKLKKNKILVVVGAILAGLILVVLAKYGVGLAAMGLLIYDSFTTPIEVYEDVELYNRFMGVDAKEEFVSKWSMDETIFPEKITDNMQVDDYIMVYYNPWDAQFLSFLEVTYEEADYAKEVERLTEYKSTKYEGYYGVTGFDEDYTLLAMHADSYNGFVYALTDNEDTIIYVELIYCNYHFDLEYTTYIPNEYLPVGFDATHDNPYEKEMMKDNNW